MQQLGSTEQGRSRRMNRCNGNKVVVLGQVNQQQFVAGVQRLISPGELEELLHFDIIPSHILEESNRLPSLPGSATNIRAPVNGYGNNDLVGDEQLRQLANRASQKNWSKLAITLGFLEYDIEAYRTRHNYDNTAAVNRTMLVVI